MARELDPKHRILLLRWRRLERMDGRLQSVSPADRRDAGVAAPCNGALLAFNCPSTLDPPGERCVSAGLRRLVPIALVGELTRHPADLACPFAVHETPAISVPTAGGQIARFGVFELDPHAGELRKRGVKLTLQAQPLALLLALVERPGELITRTELRERLWPSGTFVDFDHSLATSISKLRRALGDSATRPCFIETLPRRGYRFLAGVQRDAASVTSPAVQPTAIDSLAVLPFDNVLGDTASEYLSDGLTDSIIISLSRLPGVRVMARTTVFRYKGRAVDPGVVGLELRVGAILAGRVRQRTDSV